MLGLWERRNDEAVWFLAFQIHEGYMSGFDAVIQRPEWKLPGWVI